MERITLKVKGAAYKSHVRPAILCGSEVWHMNKRTREFYKDP